jgi:hypothetical protein
MGRGTEERCGVEERHCFGGGRGEGNEGRNRYGWTFKRKRCGGGPDARSAIGTLSRASHVDSSEDRVPILVSASVRPWLSSDWHGQSWMRLRGYLRPHSRRTAKAIQTLNTLQRPDEKRLQVQVPAIHRPTHISRLDGSRVA